MKRTILVLVAIIAMTSCYKKSTSDQRIFYCVQNDSMVSTIPVLSNPHYKVISGYWDNVNQSRMDFVMKDFAHKDTIWNRHDTLDVEYWTMTCDQVE